MPASLPDIGLGTYQTPSDVCADVVETALEVGYRHVDTAEMYDNESGVGAGLAAADVPRDEVFVATKLHSSNLGAGDVREHALACRDRLGVEIIDLLYVHWPLRAYDPADTLPAFDALHDDGVVRNVGVSNFTPALLEDAVDRLDAPLFAHQVECHPLLPQRELRRLAREHDHFLVAYSPLAKGRVTEVPELVEIADKHDATPAQVSLAWLRSKENVVPIPKTTSETHLRENLGAVDLALEAADVARIDAIDRRERVVDFEGAPWR